MNKTVKQYTLFGALFGAMFPLMAWIFQFWHLDLAYSFTGFAEMYIRCPLLYMITSAPLFLGLFAYVMGRYKAAAETYNVQLHQLVDELKRHVKKLTQPKPAQNKAMASSLKLPPRWKGPWQACWVLANVFQPKWNTCWLVLPHNSKKLNPACIPWSI